MQKFVFFFGKEGFSTKIIFVTSMTMKGSVGFSSEFFGTNLKNGKCRALKVFSLA